MAIAEIKKVRASDTGMDQSTPSRPRNRGSSRANPTPNTISRTMDSTVDSRASPRDWEVDEGGLVDAGQGQQAEIDPESLDSELRVVMAFVGRAENPNQLAREELRNQ